MSVICLQEKVHNSVLMLPFQQAKPQPGSEWGDATRHSRAVQKWPSEIRFRGLSQLDPHGQMKILLCYKSEAFPLNWSNISDLSLYTLATNVSRLWESFLKPVYVADHIGRLNPVFFSHQLLPASRIPCTLGCNDASFLVSLRLPAVGLGVVSTGFSPHACFV